MNFLTDPFNIQGRRTDDRVDELEKLVYKQNELLKLITEALSVLEGRITGHENEELKND